MLIHLTTLYNVCVVHIGRAVHQEMFSTLGHISEYTGNIMSTLGVFSTVRDIMMSVDGIISTAGGIQYTWGYHDECGCIS